jgi:hypothetical protein
MKRIKGFTVFGCLIISCLSFGCGGGVDETEPEAGGSPASALPSVAEGDGSAIGEPGASTETPTPPSAPEAIDISPTGRPVNVDGSPMGDLDLLNHAIEAYRELAHAKAAEALSRRRFSSEAEQSAAEAELARASSTALKDLSDLVRAGVLRALPTPPAGKQFVLNLKTQQAELADAK